MNVDIWKPSPESLSLSDDEIHIWKIHLTSRVSENLLSHEEQHRAKKLLVDEKRDQFLRARSALRTILAKYILISPAGIELEYSSHGKPFLKGRPLHFNLSHSKKWAVIAITLKSPVGIDLEFIADDVSGEAIVERYFNSQEKLALEREPSLRQNRFFYRLWTRKESLMKLTGLGWSGKEDLSTEAPVSRYLPIAKNYLACASFSSSITSINKYCLY